MSTLLYLANCLSEGTYPPNGGFSFLCLYIFNMLVTDARCDLFQVLRTDLSNWDQIPLTYPPSDFITAVRRAQYYQQTYDPGRSRWDYRVDSVD